MIGHEFLTSIKILHRSISENSIVLGLYHWGERGCLIDLDVGMLREAEKSTRASSTQSANQIHQAAKSNSTPSTKSDEKRRVKGLPTVGIILNHSVLH